MTQLVCNGVRLDLPDDGKLQFKQDNPLWAFDNMACERTTEFKLPATPTNDAVFQLARIPAYYGEGMRRRFECQFTCGQVVQNGLLYLTGWKKGEYSAVLLSGVLLNLKRLRDAGTFKDVLYPRMFDPSDPDYKDMVTIAQTGISPADNKSKMYAQINYAGKIEFPIPSIRLHTIIEDALTLQNIPFTLPTATQYIRYIPGEPNTLADTWVNFFVVTDELRPAGGTTGVYQPHIEEYSGADGVIVLGNSCTIRYYDADNNYYQGVASNLKVMQDMTLVFPEDWDNNLFVGRFKEATAPEYRNRLANTFQFLGDRSFDEQGNITGESLRDRSINLAQGETFAIIRIGCHVNNAQGRGWVFPTSPGSSQGGNPDYRCGFTAKGSDVTVGGVVRMYDNLPDITIVDALKILAAMSGKMLFYTERAGVVFEDVDYSTWAVFYLDERITERGEVKRTFSDYKQRNIVCFDSGSNVPEKERIKIDYPIDNDTLDADKDLQTIPFSEGREGGLYDSQVLLKAYDGDETLADADTSASIMARAFLIKNSGLQSLCDASTQFKVKAHMLLLEYESITPKTLLQLDGKRYVWTSLEWQEDEASITLARLP